MGPVAPTFDGKAPEPIQDTPEVAAAKAAHIALVEANQLPVHTYTLPVAPTFDGKAPEPAAAKAAHIAKVEGNVLPAEHVFYDLPVAPVHEYELPVAPVYDGKAPEPVQDTPEVAAAKAAHIALVEANA